MKHGAGYRRLNRTKAHRRALFRNMASQLFQYEKLETTIEKAKELRPIVEKLVTMAGEDTLSARRKAYGYVPDKRIVHKLFSEIGPRFKARPGGYTRIIRTRRRHGDMAELASIQLVTEEFVVSRKTSSRRSSKRLASSKQRAAK